jgi:predicted membrane protein
MNNILHIAETIVFVSIALWILFKVTGFLFEIITAIREGAKEGLEELYEKNGVSSFGELKAKKRIEKSRKA